VLHACRATALSVRPYTKTEDRVGVCGCCCLNNLHVEYARGRRKYGILFLFSLSYEYSNLEYAYIHAICTVDQAEYVIRIRVAASPEYENTYSTSRLNNADCNTQAEHTGDVTGAQKFSFFNPSQHTTHTTKAERRAKESPRRLRRRRVASRPEVASREKTRPPPVSGGSSHFFF